MTEIRMPKLNNNDDTYTLVEWLVADEKPVEPDDLIATVETSKASEDLVCTHAGVLRHMAKAGAEYAPGHVIAAVVPPGTPQAAPIAPVVPGVPGGREPGSGPVITAPARALIDELGVDLDRVVALGVKVVRASDVERLASEQPVSGRVVTLAAGQQAVARTVERSHQTIPSAYTAVRVDVGAAVAEAQLIGQRHRKLVGLPEFLVAAVARLHASFPLFYASPVDSREARLSETPNVGVTIDIGKGLFVPVVKDAASLTLMQIIDALSGFRRTALTGTFREQDLSDGNIGVTLHNDPDVVVAIPMIFPGQTAALALTGAHQELGLDADGQVTSRLVSNIGVAYDHRFINGRDAVLYLRAVQELLESPAQLLG